MLAGRGTGVSEVGRSMSSMGRELSAREPARRRTTARNEQIRARQYTALIAVLATRVYVASGTEGKLARAEDGGMGWWD